MKDSGSGLQRVDGVAQLTSPILVDHLLDLCLVLIIQQGKEKLAHAFDHGRHPARGRWRVQGGSKPIRCRRSGFDESPGRSGDPARPETPKASGRGRAGPQNTAGPQVTYDSWPITITGPSPSPSRPSSPTAVRRFSLSRASRAAR